MMEIEMAVGRRGKYENCKGKAGCWKREIGAGKGEYCGQARTTP